MGDLVVFPSSRWQGEVSRMMRRLIVIRGESARREVIRREMIALAARLQAMGVAEREACHQALDFADAILVRLWERRVGKFELRDGFNRAQAEAAAGPHPLAIYAAPAGF